jgi:TolA-binding protein
MMSFLLLETAHGVATWLPPLLMVAGVVVLGVIAALMVRNTTHPAESNSDAAQVQSEAQNLLDRAEEARYQIEDVRVRVGELIGTAQRLAARLDERATRLEKLLRVADQRMDIAAPESPQSLVAAKAMSPRPIALAAHRRESAPARPAGHDRPTDYQPPAQTRLDSTKQAIYELADSGKAPLDIARELNEHVGKVELILALREA